MGMKIRSRDIKRGDLIVARAAAPGWKPALVLSARWHPDVLVLDLKWLEDEHTTTGCAFPSDEEFTVTRDDTDPRARPMTIASTGAATPHGAP